MGLACTGVVKFICEGSTMGLVEESLVGATTGPEAIRFLKASYSGLVVGDNVTYDYFTDPSYLSNEVDGLNKVV